MWMHGQRLQPSEVEQWIRDKYPYQSFLVSILEREEPEKSRIHLAITVTGPNGEPLVDINRKSVYFAYRNAPRMPQHEPDWTA